MQADRIRKHLDLFREWSESAGVWSALQLEMHRLAVRLGFPDEGELQLRPRQSQRQLIIRLGQTSDLRVFRDLFVQEQYGFARQLNGIGTVLDLGANVGYASAFFLSVFPECRLIAVEPDLVNAELCVRNLQPYGDRATVLEGAVWSRNSKLTVERGVHGDGLDWASQVRETKREDTAPAVDAWDMPTLLGKLGGSVDLLKIDIEGAEREIFSGDTSWLGRVRHLCIELHGPDCERALDEAMAPYSCDRWVDGELTICTNIRPLRAS